ncbi:serine/threonine protein kinase [Kitasatospora sp. NPDC002227]|uniref:protein kinase family protein n=1 Tax=Kitasatospora sp. NPDC002227 TaxID=3154773 RepID=UPI003326C6CC
MADGTKAVVDTSEADGAALAVALGSTPGVTPPTAPTPQGARTDTTGPRPPKAKAATAQPAVSESAVAEEPTGQPVAEEPAAKASDDPVERTAPLSTAEIAAELAVGAAALSSAALQLAADPAGSGKPAAKAAGEPAEGDADTGSLPLLLPAPLRHSGDKIAGRYRLEECVTQSQAFSSWRAVDEKLRRAVGVHLLAPGHQRARAVLAAAKSAALLGDPRFVQVLDAVQEGELVYVVREWLPDATDLATLLTDGPMEPYDAFQMVRQVTDAVAAAHRRGQAHLRLTPRCVLRTSSGQYRLNGLAVDAALRGLPTEDAERTDTRAIGALLYAALTHRWPYPEDRYDLQGLPKDLGCVPPDQVRAGVHKGLSELTARALCEQPPHHLEPVTSPEQLAKAIALMPRVRQPEPPTAVIPPVAATPRYATARPAPAPAGHPGAHPGAHPAPPAPPRRRGRRRRLVRLAKWTASAVALAAIGLGSWQLVTHLNAGTKGTDGGSQGGTSQSVAPLPPASAGKPLKIVGAQFFNPLGNSAEHPESTGNVFDGNPDTFWQTSGYYDQLGVSKAGTGIVVDLGSVQRVSAVHVLAKGATTVELHATAASVTGAAPTDSSDLPAYGSALAKGTGTDIELDPAHPLNSRYLLIWLTNLPKDVDGRYQGRIAEIKVTG